MLTRKIKSFISIPFSTKLLFAEALITSAYVKVMLVFFPFRKVALKLGTVQDQPIDIQREEMLPVIRQIRFAINLCNRYAPWPTECYTKSLTAKIMLKKRKIESILYFGFRKENNNRLAGHSWLKCSGMIVTGFCDFSQYQVHSSFR